MGDAHGPNVHGAALSSTSDQREWGVSQRLGMCLGGGAEVRRGGAEVRRASASQDVDLGVFCPHLHHSAWRSRNSQARSKPDRARPGWLGEQKIELRRIKRCRFVQVGQTWGGMLIRTKGLRSRPP